MVSYRATRIVVEGLPAGICPDCGHTHIKDETVAHLDRRLRSCRRPPHSAPPRPLRYSE